MNKVTRKNILRKNLIMRALLENKKLSLSELKDLTGISLPLVSTIVSQLAEDGFLSTVEDVEIVQAGRPPSVFKINNNAGYIVGIDLGRTGTNLVILDLELNLIHEERISKSFLANEISVIDELKEFYLESIKRNNLDESKIITIGVSLPGIVQGPKGISKTYLNFNDKNLAELFEEKFGKKVTIEHDIKAMALGELNFGLAKNKKNVICVNIGYGLAAGLIIEGKLFYGSDNYAGEFGHLQIHPDGPLCYCGKKGCLELYSSGKAIAESAINRIKGGEQTNLFKNEKYNIKNIDAKQITEAAKSGDQFCLDILEEAGKYLGYGLAQLINVFNPELIILGGKITEAEEFILDPIKVSSLKHSLIHLNRDLGFKISELGQVAGALGVARLAVNDIFEVEHLNPASLI